MRLTRKIAMSAVVAFGLAAGAAMAHPGQMGDGMGKHRSMSGTEHGSKGGKGHARMGGQSLMTPEERQKIAEARRAEMHKRAMERHATPKAPAEGGSAK